MHTELDTLVIHVRSEPATSRPETARPQPAPPILCRDIPATTQAGLFARLQATVRFMADLGEDEELYEAEWCAIKADVQRIAGEARS